MTLTFAKSFKTLVTGDEHFQSAKDNRARLSSMIKGAYKQATESLNVIKPIFRAAVSPITERMDKITIMAKSGQLPWAQAGIGNDGTNRLVKAARRAAATFRALQSRSHKLASFAPTNI